MRCALVIFFARAVPPAFPAFSAISLRRSGESAADLALAIATACGFLADVFTCQAKTSTASLVLSMEYVKTKESIYGCTLTLACLALVTYTQL